MAGGRRRRRTGSRGWGSGGNVAALKELVGYTGAGRAGLNLREYRLAHINRAIEELRDSKIKGRAVLVP
jgi:D-arabinose 1-dehydrogenase-like Zn-dependent alcohol dehydrogenase